METGKNDRTSALRILIVDDSRDAADTLACLVRFWGHEVQVCYGGREAMELARTYLPEVMMLDIGMPVLDGYQVAERVRADENLREATLIAITAYGDEANRQRATAAGFDLHLVKPVEPMLLDQILSVLRQSRRHLAQAINAGEIKSVLRREVGKLLDTFKTSINSRFG